MMKLNKIGQIAIPVRDFERAIDFYQNILNLPFQFKTQRLAFFDCGGVRLLLACPENDEQRLLGSVIYYQVDDIHKSYRELQEKGVEFIESPRVIATMNQIETWMCFFKDSEGNTLSLMSEIMI